MRGNVRTRLLVAAVLVLAGAAAYDAVRARAPDGASPPSHTADATGEETLAEAAAALRAARVTGTLAFADDGCALRAVRLPSLAPAPRPRTGPDPGCAFSLSPEGSRAASAGAAWEPAFGRRLAFCRGETVGVSIGFEGAFVEAWRGCAPSWQRDGDLTFVRGGAVFDAVTQRVLVSRAQFRRAAGRHPSAPGRASLVVTVLDVAWLTEWRVAALLAITTSVRAVEPVHAVAFFESGSLDDTYSILAPTPTRLDASSSGRFVAVRPRLLLRHNGTNVRLPDWLRDVRGIAVSPDERWAAVATRGGIYAIRTWELDLFDRAGRSPRSIRIPLVARDLAWR